MLEEMNTKHKCQQKKFGSRTTRRKKILRICYLYESRLDPSFIIFYLEYTLLNFVKDNQMQNILQGYKNYSTIEKVWKLSIFRT